jgi:2-polyprenyl-3-methyl-5-hydroxy-6-metoxy-1,4-benzoquinol methylase
MNERVECPICGHRRFGPLAHYRRAHLVRCERCRQVFSARRPADAELAHNYGQYPREDLVSPITRQRYCKLLEGFVEYRQTNRLLDFGCGLGFFLEEAQAAGWQAHGSEFESRAVEINRAKGLSCAQAPIGPDDFGPGWFDVITAFEVVEHLRDPREDARLIAQLLRPGGLFYCTTPNFASLSRRALRSRWAVIEYPEHLLYFTPRTLCGWLAEFGFQPVRLTTTGLTLARRRDGARVEAESHRLPDQEQFRATVESSRVLRSAKVAVNSVLQLLGAGDTIKGYFELSASSSPALPTEKHLKREQRP